MYKVLVTAAGIGSRLGFLTKHINKALIQVAGRPVLSYILESYSPNHEFVITVGYLSQQVKDFIAQNYANLKVTFVDVDRYDGPGSSMGYSMLQARTHLQCPFIIHCNDTLVFEPIPDPSVENWNAGTRGPSAENYTSFKVIDGYISKIADKGAKEYDFLHIGLVGIKDYKDFWESLEYLYKLNPNDSMLNDTQTINIMLDKGCKFKAMEFKVWCDVGNMDALKNTEEFLANHPQLLKKFN